MKLCITGGGTGGHLAIAKSLAQAAAKQGIECIYIGSVSGQDRKYFEHSKLFSKTYFLDTTGVVNKKGFGKFKALYKVLKALLISLTILKKERVDAVFSVGGFSAAPASFAAVIFGIPLFIHEQNAKTGRLNKILKKYAKAFFCSYDKDSPVTSYPVSETFFEKSRKRDKIDTIIFLGGSQGAKAINDLAISVAKKLQERGIHIIHQTGEKEYERVKKAYEQLGVDAEIYAFSDKLDELMKRADLAVSRAGASTLWELTANALPALFIPYPYAAGDHQFHNAQYLVKNNLAWLKREDENPKELLLQIIDENLAKKSEALKKLLHKGAAEEILAYIVKEVQRR